MVALIHQIACQKLYVSVKLKKTTKWVSLLQDHLGTEGVTFQYIRILIEIHPLYYYT